MQKENEGGWRFHLSAQRQEGGDGDGSKKGSEGGSEHCWGKPLTRRKAKRNEASVQKHVAVRTHEHIFLVACHISSNAHALGQDV